MRMKLLKSFLFIIFGMMWVSVSLVAKQDGFSDSFCIFFIGNGMIISFYGFWKWLMSFIESGDKK